MQTRDFLAEHFHELKSLRKAIHSHPELGYEEFLTSDLVAAQLEKYGVAVHRGLGGTGVVGTLRKGNSPRSIGLRADMDALPLVEQNGFAHASQSPGKMHACGHDGHTAMLLGAACYLAEKGHFDGSIHFVFQPAEETGAGAKAMMDDGLFDLFPMDAIYGMHNRAGLEAGRFGLCKEAVMAGSATFRIDILGKGGHGGRPQLCTDPIPAACSMVLALQSIVARNLDPLESAVVSVTMINAGKASNIIPDECSIGGTIRYFSESVLRLIEDRLAAIAQQTAAAYGCQSKVVIERGYPATINAAGFQDYAYDAMVQLVGPSHIDTLLPSTGSEDFAFYLQQVPGAYVFIGNGGGEHREVGHGPGPCLTHNPSYDFNDDIIPLGASFWVNLAEGFLRADERC